MSKRIIVVCESMILLLTQDSVGPKS